MKYAKGVNKWPVFFKNQFYDTYEDAKKAQGSELFYYYVIVTFLTRLFVTGTFLQANMDHYMVQYSRFMVFNDFLNGNSNKTKNNVVKSV